MQPYNVQLVGRRADQPQTILLRDQDGRFFLRPACGSRPVRITARDAERLMRQYRYSHILDADWYPVAGLSLLGCAIEPHSAELGHSN